MIKKLPLLLVPAMLLLGVLQADDTTKLGRAEFDHPNLSHTGGAALHSHVEDIYTKISNGLSMREFEGVSIADSTLTTFRHGFEVDFAEVFFLLYTGTGGTKTRVTDPAGAGWTIAANGTNPELEVDVTTPGSGGPHTFTVYAIHRGDLTIDQAASDVTDGYGDCLEGQTLVADASGFAICGDAGGGSGAGEKNYVDQANAEVTTIDQWNLYEDAAGTEPVDGTGVAVSNEITFARTTTAGEILRDTASFELSKDAADRQGEGVSQDIKIDRGDLNKKLKIEFIYQTTGTYANGDLVVCIYNVDSAALVHLDKAGDDTRDDDCRDVNDTGGNAGRFIATWSTTGDDDYRFIVHVASTSASAYQIQMDDVVVGPGRVTVGSKPWPTYTASDGGAESNCTTSGTTAQVCSDTAGHTLRNAYLRPYRDDSGAWYLEFSITSSITSATSATFKIDGVDVDDVPTAGIWSLTCANNTASYCRAQYETATNQITVSSGSSNATVSVSGTVKLDGGKPGWAEDAQVVNLYTENNLKFGTAYTPTIQNDAGHSASQSLWQYKRQGDEIIIKSAYTASGDGTDASDFTFSPPSNFTVSNPFSGADLRVGDAWLRVEGDPDTFEEGAVMFDVSAGVFNIYRLDGSTEATLEGNDFGTSAGRISSIRIDLSAPIDDAEGQETSIAGFGNAQNGESGLLQYNYEKPDISSSGDFDAAQSGKVRIARVNSMVTISFDSLTNSDADGNIDSAAGFIPLEYRPDHTETNAIGNDASTIQKIVILSDGTFRIQVRDYTGALVTTGPATEQGSISYLLNE